MSPRDTVKETARPAPKVVAVLTRRTDLEADAQTGTAGAPAVEHATFTRRSTTGPVPVDKMGLCGSLEYHRSKDSVVDIPRDRNQGERAILIQLAEHSRLIRRARENLELGALGPGAFGENLFVEGGPGFHSGTICVGDVYDFCRDGSAPVCRLEVSSPRRPCSKVDEQHGKTYNLDGVRAHCASTGHAGVFCRVLTAGDIAEGDTIRLAERPHPTWNLRRISRLLYGRPSTLMGYLRRAVRRSEWLGTDEELTELAGIEQLAYYEWGEDLSAMLGKGARFRDQKRSYHGLVVSQNVQRAFVLAFLVLLVGVCSKLVQELVENKYDYPTFGF